MTCACLAKPFARGRTGAPHKGRGWRETRRSASRQARRNLLACIQRTTAIVARLFEHRYRGLGYVAAWAEAATIGGLADWYAVVALFRHPFGIPLPHTAIISNNQQRITDSFAGFVEEQFSRPSPSSKNSKKSTLPHWPPMPGLSRSACGQAHHRRALRARCDLAGVIVFTQQSTSSRLALKNTCG